MGKKYNFLKEGDESMSKEVVLTLNHGFTDDGKIDVEITIKGESNMPSHCNDLKVKAILAILNTIDIKQYYEESKQDEGYQSAKEIMENTKYAFGLDIF